MKNKLQSTRPTSPTIGFGEGGKDLGRASVRSGAINMGAQAASVFLGLASTIVLARLLTPEAYGIIGMVATVIAFASLFKDLGLSTATIQRKDLNTDQVSAMFWLNVLAGLALFGVVALSSPLIARFYQKPELLWVTAALGSNILLSSLGAQHAALLTRQMRFLPLAACRISGAVTTLVVAILAALAGWEHWALVAGALSGSFAHLFLLWIFSPFRPRFVIRGTGSREMVKYGLNITGFDLVNYFGRNLDNILIGRVWGPMILGYYTRAYSLFMVPISNIRTPLMAVALPSMSRLQHEDKPFFLYYKKLVLILSMGTIPIATFCFLFSDLLIYVLLGASWMVVAGIAKWLALAGILQPVSGTLGVVLLSKGMARRHLSCGLIGASVKAVAFGSSVWYGVETMAKVYAIVSLVQFFPMFIFATRGINITLSEFLGCLIPATIASIAGGAAAWILKTEADLQYGITSIVVVGFSFMIFYGAFLLLFKNARNAAVSVIIKLRPLVGNTPLEKK